ncbi:hypothetical protein QJS10_CPB12g00826 [Acorus calamus]|uniref:Uncharacterized protein n=1 Tax=Acorus calamus TaxID=4465 RepID=A0AAV9DMP2_ACOCL|nr:hypothetical protein QJS10_CPB12g00826 [Acorus calamus]
MGRLLPGSRPYHDLPNVPSLTSGGLGRLLGEAVVEAVPTGLGMRTVGFMFKCSRAERGGGAHFPSRRCVSGCRCRWSTGAGVEAIEQRMEDALMSEYHEESVEVEHEHTGSTCPQPAQTIDDGVIAMTFEWAMVFLVKWSDWKNGYIEAYKGGTIMKC